MKKRIAIFFATAATAILATLNISLAFSALPAPLTKDELLKLHSRTQQWKSYRIDFRVTLGKQIFDGIHEMSGPNFHISTPEVELFSDGTTKWEVNRLYREVIIDTLSEADRNILANPAQFFDQMSGGVKVEILNVLPNFAPGADFRFDAARYPGYETIDFRK
jgi:hypothetical protein